MSTDAGAAMDWSAIMAPSLEDFEQLAQRAFARLPDAFRSRCAGLIIRIEDFAEDEVVEELDLDDAFDLMGLYQGVTLAGRDNALPAGPDMVLLYRRAILDYWAEYEETLGTLVTHVLVHEIGHHFGLSDADMEAIEAASHAQPEGVA